ncbi:MAG: FHIPEP family type III secretion protein, partial [Planctomycetales bacterium]|nr:FHIPEP family type III secretion protein [Planctomycetales bacterium]
MSSLLRWKELVLPVGLIACVLVIIVPLPAPVLDLLLAANITAAILMLLTTITVRTPLEFSVFPTLLLATTLSRLVLNVASTRLILTRAGEDGLAAAGGVIRGFGQFVTGDNLVVGLIIFVILIVIQFVVITKGATRISEVAARFALDGMPGRQMAIDADLNAGLIDQHEAQQRRGAITQQADFYGAMDGASKFVRGDAIAGIVITLTNILGGLVIGVFQSGLSIAEAGSRFTTLTIGDGLVSQLPALLISLAAGLLVTRSTQHVELSNEFLRQLFHRPQTLAVAAVFLGVLVLTNLPKLPLLAIGGGCVGLSLLLSRQQREQQAARAAAAAASEKPKAATEERIEQYLHVDPLELEIGVGLIRLADPKRGGDLLQRIASVRRAMAAEMGLVLPKVRVRDNMRLGELEYRVKIATNPVARGALQPQRLLAIEPPGAAGQLDGEATREPHSGRPAVWITPDRRSQATSLGYAVIEPAVVLATHLRGVFWSHADELLTRDALQHLLNELKQTAPAAVDELIPDVLRLAEVQQVLQALLREQVPIRQLALILETLGEQALRTRDVARLTEIVRQRLARTLSTQHRD